MKVIITGSTGMIGTEVLLQCLQHPEITSIIALSRRDLPATIVKSPKLQIIVLADFMAYPRRVLQDIVDAEACIWCLGGHAGKYPSVEIAHKVNVDYTITAANAWVNSFIPHLGQGKKFRFLYVSGIIVERDPEAKISFLADTRKMKGEVINKLAAISQQHPDIFEALFPMPGGVVPRGLNAASVFMAVTKTLRMDRLVEGMKTLRVEELAAAMIKIALKGSGTQDIGHDVLERSGRELLRGSEEGKVR